MVKTESNELKHSAPLMLTYAPDQHNTPWIACPWQTNHFLQLYIQPYKSDSGGMFVYDRQSFTVAKPYKSDSGGMFLYDRQSFTVRLQYYQIDSNPTHRSSRSRTLNRILSTYERIFGSGSMLMSRHNEIAYELGMDSTTTHSVRKPTPTPIRTPENDLQFEECGSNAIYKWWGRSADWDTGFHPDVLQYCLDRNMPMTLDGFSLFKYIETHVIMDALYNTLSPNIHAFREYMRILSLHVSPSDMNEYRKPNEYFVFSNVLHPRLRPELSPNLFAPIIDDMISYEWLHHCTVMTSHGMGPVYMKCRNEIMERRVTSICESAVELDHDVIKLVLAYDLVSSVPSMMGNEGYVKVDEPPTCITCKIVDAGSFNGLRFEYGEGEDTSERFYGVRKLQLVMSAPPLWGRRIDFIMKDRSVKHYKRLNECDVLLCEFRHDWKTMAERCEFQPEWLHQIDLTLANITDLHQSFDFPRTITMSRKYIGHTLFVPNTLPLSHFHTHVTK